MDYSEKWGRDVDEAVQLALDDLKVSIDEVDVTVLEEPSRGFFGIGSKLALVRVEKKKPPVEEKPEPPVQAEPVKTQEEAPKKQNKEKNQNKQDRAPKPKKEKKSSDHSDVKKEAVSNKEPEEDLQTVSDHAALTFLREVVKEMGLDVCYC